jgi:hypothetical protein
MVSNATTCRSTANDGVRGGLTHTGGAANGRRMRWVFAWLALAAVLSPWSARSESSQPQQTTQVACAVPDLAGRWLVVTRVELAPKSELGITTTTLWTVVTADGKPEITLRQAELPPAVQASLEKANAAHAVLEPRLRELQELQEAWTGLPVLDRGIARVETKITSSDAFDTVMKGEERMKGARFVVQQVVDFSPGEGRPIKDVYIYGALEPRPDGWSGNYMSATVAPTPVPIPITLNGTFRAYRLESIAGRGLLARILDVFSGCGRR